MRLLTACALLTVAALTAGAADDPKDAAKKLEGTYEVVGVLIAGKPDPEKNALKAVEIKGGQLVMKVAAKDEPAKFTLDPSQKPAHIDIAPDGLDLKIMGIYEAKETDKGLELTIAAAMGPTAARPKDFKGEGKEEVVLTLLRKKAK